MDHVKRPTTRSVLPRRVQWSTNLSVCRLHPDSRRRRCTRCDSIRYGGSLPSPTVTANRFYDFHCVTPSTPTRAKGRGPPSRKRCRGFSGQGPTPRLACKKAHLPTATVLQAASPITDARTRACPLQPLLSHTNMTWSQATCRFFDCGQDPYSVRNLFWKHRGSVEGGQQLLAAL